MVQPQTRKEDGYNNNINESESYETKTTRFKDRIDIKASNNTLMIGKKGL